MRRVSESARQLFRVNCSVVCPRYRDSNAGAKHDEGARRIVPLAITPGAKSVYGFWTGIRFRGGFREEPCGDYPIRFVISEWIAGAAAERSGHRRLERAKVLDGLAQAVFKRHTRFPTQDAARLSDVGLALFRIVLRERLVNDA